MDCTHSYRSPLGMITLASDGKALTGLWFEGQKYYASTLSPSHEERMLPIFEQTDTWLDLYFSGKVPDFTPHLCPKGTGFRESVWDILLTIPYGKTMTYGEIAGIIARRTGTAGISARAVGGAVGHNPISIIIPCHRVIGSSGSLTGYAGGLERKIRLLTLEGASLFPSLIPQ